MSAPSVHGDSDGLLRNAISYALSNSHIICTSDGRYELFVQLLDQQSSDRIGFRYDRQSSSSQNLLVSIEGRKNVVAEITLKDCANGRTLLEKKQITASSDYDHIDSDALQDLLVFTPSPKLSLHFSGGQLDTIEGAESGVAAPLMRKLADKILQEVEMATSTIPETIQ